eukprot:6490332-Amphidinium_carterae.1
MEVMPTSVLLRMASEDNDRLCSVRMSDGAIRWRLQSRPQIMAQSALGEAHALRKWLIKFGSLLHAEGRSEIESALQIMGVESGPTPLPPTRPYYRQLVDASLMESYNAASAADVTQPDIADNWHVGSESFCAYFLAQGPELWLQTGAPPQRAIPKSCEHLVQSHLIWLHECSQSMQLTQAQRQVALLYVLLAPRMLWPSPLKGERLAPHTRPTIVKERCAMLREGQWDELLDTLMADFICRKRGNQDVVPNVPGLITKNSAKRIQRAAGHGRVGAAWRQLWSYGVAPSTEHTMGEIKAKWRTMPQDSCPEQGAPLPQIASARIASAERLHKASQRLKTGTAFDALGWCTESMHQVLQAASAAACVRQITESYLRSELPSTATDLLNIALIIPLNKNDAGGIRPISIPTVFRKLAATVSILEFATHISQYVGASQHGAGMSSGAAVMAERVDLLIAMDPQRLFVQVDIANAFSSASRRSTLEALRDCAPELAVSQQSWLCRPAQAVVTQPDGTRVVLSTSNGIPQGDPLSSLAFACLLRKATKEFLHQWRRGDTPQAADAADASDAAGAAPQPAIAGPTALEAASAAHVEDMDESAHMRLSACPGIDILAYADDIILVLHPSLATGAWELWKRVLAQHHLQVQSEKTVVYHPQGSGPIDGELQRVFMQQPSKTGLVLCGLPIWDKRSGSEDTPAIPFGSREFVSSYLTSQAQVFEGRLQALVSLQESLESEAAQHMALYLLRSSVLAKHIHLLRAIPTPLLLGWARRADEHVQLALTRILDLPDLAPEKAEALQLPVSCGGLGFHSLAWEAAKHHISHVLAIRAKYGNLASSMMQGRRSNPLPQAANAASESASADPNSASADHSHGISAFHATGAATDDEWPWGFQQAASLFEELSGQSICLVLKKTQHELLSDGCKHATPLLTTALYKPVRRVPHFQPAPLVGDHRNTSPAFLYRTALLWFHFPGQFFVDDASLRMFVRYFLQLPLLVSGHRCQYQTRVRGTTCGHQGDCFGRHAQACCAGPIQARHDRLRDEWAELAHMAGWTTATEQAIPVAAPVRPLRSRRASTAQAASAAPDGSDQQAAGAAPLDRLLGDTVRADLIFLTPGGKRIVGDVAVTHSWLPQSSSDALTAMETTKYKKYCVPDSTTSMPGGELFFPLVHHPSGHMGAAAVKLAMQIVDDLAGKLRNRMRMSKSKAQQYATFQ